MDAQRIIHAIDLDQEFDEFEELSVLSFGEGANPSLDMYRWLFDRNPYNPPAGNLMFVMRDMAAGGKMIASDGLTPFRLQVDGRTVSAAHSVKSMTHPDYKRQGIFRAMTENSLENGRKAGIEVVLGFANKASYPAYQKFGWTTLFEREVYVFPANITNKAAGMLKSRALGRLANGAFQGVSRLKRAGKHALRRFTVEEYDAIPPQAGLLWEKYKDRFGCCIVRDLPYLQYRYDKRPDTKYKTLLLRGEEGSVGYAVLRKSIANGKPMVCVAENFTDPGNEEYVRALAEAIIDWTYAVEADYAVVCSGLFGRYDEVLRSYGFAAQKGQGTIVIAKSLSPSIDEASLVGAGRWHLTQGDGESELDL